MACVLRPTNILIWVSLSCFMLFRVTRHQRIVQLKWPDMPLIVTTTWPAFLRATAKERKFLVTQVAICGYAILCLLR